jgi:hypothetical protein
MSNIINNAHSLLLSSGNSQHCHRPYLLQFTVTAIALIFCNSLSLPAIVAIGFDVVGEETNLQLQNGTSSLSIIILEDSPFTVLATLEAISK